MVSCSRAAAVVDRVLRHRAVFLLALAGFVASFATLGCRLVHDPSAQWDLHTYHAAGRAWRAGDNPYTLEALSRAQGSPVELPFVYPPATLPLFGALGSLDPSTAARLYLALELLALAGLVLVWFRTFVREPGARVLLLVLCVFGFSRPLQVDLTAGNISIFEQLIVWGGFTGLVAGRRVRFALLVAASASFKLVTLALLVLGWARGRVRGALLACAVGVASWATVNVPALVLWPDAAASFRRNVAGLDERGRHQNPSSLAYLRDAADALRHAGRALPPHTETVAWALFAATIGALALARLWRPPEPRDLPRWLSVALLAFALMMPRFKDYAYVLLLVPTALVLDELRRVRPLLALAALAVVVTANRHDYLPLGAALLIFAFSLAPSRNPDGRPADRPVLASDTPPTP